MSPYNRLTIDLQAVHTNIVTIQGTLPPSGRVMPMIKAQAYGTDSATLATHLQKWGIEIVGVSHVQEGIELRNKGCALSIFSILAAPFEASDVVEHDLEVGVSDFTLCQRLNDEALKRGKRVKVHLDIDTGMKRFGVLPTEALSLARGIMTLPGLIFEGVMTHFLAAENPLFDSVTKRQIALFEQVLNELTQAKMTPRWIHTGNSAGMIRFPLPYCNMVRIGAATFGLYSSEAERKVLSLTPALTLDSKVVSLNDCVEGDHIGYSQSYRVKRAKEKMAILPIGYHDGFHLHTSGKGYVLIHGKKAPYVGRICMDFMTVDVTDIQDVKIGDRAIIFGPGLPIEEVAANLQTNVREIVACLGSRVERHFLAEPSPLIPLRSLYKNEALPQGLPC